MRNPHIDRGEGAPGVEVVAIFGPTASGKSAVAERVADRLGTEVVSVDALQVYAGLPILTNQPVRRTRLVGIRSLEEQMTVGEFAPLVHAEIDALVNDRRAAVIAGGTGLYLRAAIAELDIPPATDETKRRRIELEARSSPAGAHERLSQLDPVAAGVVHPNDTQRLVRALALAEAGGTLTPRRSELWTDTNRLPTVVFGLDVPADVLERRIRGRAEEMFARGVVDEVRTALRVPISRTVEKALGLREITALDGDEALERIVVRTRRYAAYQRKWMRRIPGVVLVDGERDAAMIADEIVARTGWAPA